MTLKGFSEKYGIPYMAVSEATVRIFPKPTIDRDNDYDEHEVFIAVYQMYQRKQREAQQKVRGYGNMCALLFELGVKHGQIKQV